MFRKHLKISNEKKERERIGFTVSSYDNIYRVALVVTSTGLLSNIRSAPRIGNS